MQKTSLFLASAILSLIILSTFAVAEENEQLSESEQQAIDNALMSYSGDVTSKEFSTMCYERERTLVAGRIYMEDTNASVKGAKISVQCNHNGNIFTKNITSKNFGLYSVIFRHNQCDENDVVTVFAQKGGLFGSEEGIIQEGHGVFKKFDIAIINVPLVPEFTFVVSMITILGALTAFFVIRRK
jgi:hypothetical protein